MITDTEERFLTTRAYIPEHVPPYVAAISGMEPYLLGNYLCYRGASSMVFVGYPLTSPCSPEGMNTVLEAALARFEPESVTLIAPAVSVRPDRCLRSDSDHYYRLDLPPPPLSPKLRNTIRRASRDLHVHVANAVGDEHACLIAEFLDSHPVSPETRFIYERIPAYVTSVPTALVFSARNARGDLVAFDVAEFGAAACAFYQFNFVSRTRYVPGASDLLLHEVLKAAQELGKSFINLGLGIHAGVIRFKRKWGGTPFLAYELRRYRPALPPGFQDLLRKL